MPTRGHAVGTGYIGVSVRPDRIQMVLSVCVTDVAEHVGPVSDRGTLPLLLDDVRSRVSLEADSTVLPLDWTPSAGIPDSFYALFGEEQMAEIYRTSPEDGRPQYLHFRAEAPLRVSPRAVAVSADFSKRFGDLYFFLVNLHNAEQVQTAVLNRDHSRQEFPLQGEVSLWRQTAQFVRLGVEHILCGYDHLLFLLALLVVGGRVSALVKIITAFTVAHSITLIAATLGWVHLPSRWVEPAIALTIVYVGVENFFARNANHRWILTFFFGLIHGFGFAGVLREMGLPARGLFSALLSFNVGVEIGQLTVVACLLPVVRRISRSRLHAGIVRTVSALVVLLGMIWFVERAVIFTSSGR